MNKSKKVTDLHNQAMKIAEKGYFAQREGDKVAANSQKTYGKKLMIL